jgi:uncharacterized protein YkwD
MSDNRVFKIAFFCLLLTGCVPVPNVEEQDSSENTTTEEVVVEVEEETNNLPVFAAEMLTLVNQLRTDGCKCGNSNMPSVGKLVWNQQLAEAARRHADDLVANNIFSHTGSDQSEIKDRVMATEYDWSSIGENIAKGYTEIGAVIAGWKSSEGHCKNMMGASFTEVGTAQNGIVWVQVLGSRQVQ